MVSTSSMGSMVLIFLITLLLFTSTINAATKVTVNTKLGPITGDINRVGRSFTNIRYAHQKRWESSTPVEPWTQSYDASGDLPSCPQICELPRETCAKPEQMTEDCLFLNIYTPLNPTGARLPVLIWYHGGRYQQGYAGGDLYWAEELAVSSIVVSVNYRLGALGYMYDPAKGIHGNFGLKDQILALQFVRHVIDAFGGDVNKITISGQSAGAGSVASILSAPSTHGMYANAILFSNPFTIPFRNIDSQLAFSKAFATSANCTTREELDALPLHVVYDAQVKAFKDVGVILTGAIHMFLPYTPTAGTPDGLLPVQPYEAFTTGKIPHNVNIIITTTSDEAPIFIYGAAENPVLKAQYESMLIAIVGFERQAKIIKRFPASTVEGFDHRPLLVQIANEYIFEYANNFISKQTILARPNEDDRKRIFNARFDHVFGDGTIWDHLEPLCGKSCCHAAELPILFLSSRITDRVKYTNDEIQFASNVRKQLLNFLWTGNPNKGPVQALNWDYYYRAHERLHWEVGQFDMFRQDLETQTFWDDVGYDLHK